MQLLKYKKDFRHIAVLFDLDGTFLDSAPDFQVAANLLCAEYNLVQVPIEFIIPKVSRGSRAIVEALFSTTQIPDTLDVLQEKFLNYYESILGAKSQVFEGMNLLLDTLDSFRISWGIVTNKKKRFTEPLLKKLDYLDRTHCIVSGDTTPHQKPHPAPLHHACHILKRDPSQCIFVGDAQFDIEAGRHAGMTTIAALYGYIEDQTTAANWGADYTVTSTNEIWDRIETWMR